ncbi:TrbC/VirB2 family protein [Asticcacaulis sp. W401b]|uniref:TrbC/VirB2 family protein n=1 Tax=Asticcacaulis sp. W401b TaxID=3388666 RepID=UPI0039705414
MVARSQPRWAKRPRMPQILAASGVLMLAASPAFAQIEKLTSVLENVKTALLGIGVVAFTIMIAWAGYKMGFQHAKWSEVSNIVIGAVLVGGAAAIAGWLIN